MGNYTTLEMLQGKERGAVPVLDSVLAYLVDSQLALCDGDVETATSCAKLAQAILTAPCSRMIPLPNTDLGDERYGRRR